MAEPVGGREGCSGLLRKLHFSWMKAAGRAGTALGHAPWSPACDCEASCQSGPFVATRERLSVLLFTVVV